MRQSKMAGMIKAIRIGDDYQAELPPEGSISDPNRSDTSPPKKGNIWSSANSLSDEEMDEFFIRANKIINEIKYRKLLDFQASLSSSSRVDFSEEKLIVDGSWVAVNCDIRDTLHQLLYSCKFNKQKTLILVGSSILPYISVWSMQEQQTCNENLQGDFDIDKLASVLPQKTVTEIQNYHLRYINSATELESNLLSTEPESVRGMLQRLREERQHGPTVIPKYSTSSRTFMQRIGSTFDPLTYQQVLSSLICYHKGICSPAELVVRVRCVIENAVVSVVSSTSSSPKNAPNFDSKLDALNDFFMFLPEPIRSKLMVI